jgi:P27 family predicted phage terminase small subunit
VPRQTPPPENFTDEERKVWLQAQHQLRSQGTWKPADRDLLEQYSRAIVLARQARQNAAAQPVVEGSAGQPVPSPSIKIARDAEADARACATDLLLTPAARRRAGVDNAADETPADWMSGVG